MTAPIMTRTASIDALNTFVSDLSEPNLTPQELTQRFNQHLDEYVGPSDETELLAKAARVITRTDQLPHTMFPMRATVGAWLVPTVASRSARAAEAHRLVQDMKPGETVNKSLAVMQEAFRAQGIPEDELQKMGQMLREVFAGLTPEAFLVFNLAQTLSLADLKTATAIHHTILRKLNEALGNALVKVSAQPAPAPGTVLPDLTPDEAARFPTLQRVLNEFMPFNANAPITPVHREQISRELCRAIAAVLTVDETTRLLDFVQTPGGQVSKQKLTEAAFFLAQTWQMACDLVLSIEDDELDAEDGPEGV